MTILHTIWDEAYYLADPYNSYSNGGLTVAFDLSAISLAASSGKFYVEFTLETGEPLGELFLGVIDQNGELCAVDVVGGRIVTGQLSALVFGSAPFSEPLTPPCTIGMYFDTSDGSVGVITSNGNAGLVGTVSAGTAPYKVFAYKDQWQYSSHISITANFGATAFTYAVPDGYESGFGETLSGIISPGCILSAFGGASANIAAPGVSTATINHASVNVVSPACTLDASGCGGAFIAAPRVVIFSYGHDSTGENAATVVAPKAALSAYAGANAKFNAPASTLLATGTGTAIGRASITAPSATVAASGTVSYMTSVAIAAPSATLVGYGGALCSVTTGAGTVQATGTTGSVGRATLTAPLFELTASGTRQNYGSADLIAPAARMGATAQAWLIAPGAALTAIGTAVVAVTYEAYAVNLARSALFSVGPRSETEASPPQVTHYTNYPFDYVVRYRNSYFGANATGLYLLEGTTDDGTAIPFAVQTHLSDFKTPNLKTVASAYLSGRIGAAETVSLTAGENNPVTHNFTTPRGAKAQNHRQKFGLGTKARYFSVGVSGTQQFELDAVELEVVAMNRRI